MADREGETHMEGGDFGSRDQPMIYAALMEPATRGLMDEVEARLSSSASEAAHAVTGWVHEQIRQAYVAGVRDGFAQGVAAVERSSAEVARG